MAGNFQPPTGKECNGPHVAACKQKSSRPEVYDFFSAAYDGCVPCVTKALESNKVQVTTVSDSGQYTALCWARHGMASGKNTAAVLELLANYGSSGAPAGATSSAAAAVEGMEPVPGSRRESDLMQEHGRVRVGAPKEASVGTDRGQHPAMCWAEHCAEASKDTAAVVPPPANCSRSGASAGSSIAAAVGVTESVPGASIQGDLPRE
jgi:hypothetical protein